LLVIFGAVRSARASVVPFAVAAYIGGAYFFTSSTSFANPAVTFARMFSDTFAGIAPRSVPTFFAGQLLGLGVATLAIRLLYPSMEAVSNDVVVPHPDERKILADQPKEVLFACVHNSGRSRMAEAFFNDEVAKRGISDLRAVSAGTQPSDAANPTVVATMAEVGLHIPETPGRLLTLDLTKQTIKFISMGCGDAEACPARLRDDMEDWEIEDPKGQSIEKVREIREVVRQRVVALVDELTAN